MKVKPVIPRAQARQDVEDAIAHYLAGQVPEAALGFIDALKKGFRHIARHPASGSPRSAHELDLPGLRAWPLSGYPHLIFYVEQADRIDVWRVLHGQCDLPAWMQAHTD